MKKQKHKKIKTVSEIQTKLGGCGNSSKISFCEGFEFEAGSDDMQEFNLSISEKYEFFVCEQLNKKLIELFKEKKLYKEKEDNFFLVENEEEIASYGEIFWDSKKFAHIETVTCSIESDMFFIKNEDNEYENVKEELNYTISRVHTIDDFSYQYYHETYNFEDCEIEFVSELNYDDNDEKKEYVYYEDFSKDYIEKCILKVEELE